MTMPWLFGEEHANPDGSGGLLQSMTLDIDIVSDIYRLMVARMQVVNSGTLDPNPLATMHPNHIASLTPRVAVAMLPPGYATEIEHDVPIAAVTGLGKHERRGLKVYGAGVDVALRSGHPPVVGTSEPAVAGDLGAVIYRLLKAEGRRRVNWWRVASTLPIVFALAVTGLGLWTVIASDWPLSGDLFVIAILVAVWAGAVAMQRHSFERSAMRRPGVRFREVSRVDLRDRITNARATAIVSAVTVPAGVIIGWALTQWLG